MNEHLNRRQLLGGGLLLSVAALAGCAKKAMTGRMATPNLDEFLAGQANKPVVAAKPPQEWGLPSGVLPRSRWTRSGVARPREIYPMGGIHRITVHHDGMPPVWIGSAAEAADRIEVIRRSHVEARGFADIGYHYVIDPQGRIWEGRSVVYQGAHVHDHNEHNLGVLVLGNFERQTPTAAATASLDRFVASQMERYSVPMARVKTHREITVTECPGENLQRYMVATRGRGGSLAALAAAGTQAALAG